MIMLTIGSAAGAASFTHVHNLAAAHGQGGWLAWADAIVLELMSIASGLELRRRKREAQHVAFPALVLVAAVGLSLSAQVVEAEYSVIGWIAAALPAAAFLAMVKIALGRAGTAHRPVAQAGDETLPAVRDGGPWSGTIVPAGNDTSDGGSLPSPATDGGEQPSEADGLVPAAIAAAAAMAREGRPLSRESLAEALRAQGLAMSNARAGELVRLVRQRVDGAADEPSGHPDGVLSAGAGHRADA